VFVCASLAIAACGKARPAEKPAGEAVTVAQSAESAKAPAPAARGFQKIGDVSDAWRALYSLNEKAINNYDAMPIMGLVTPPLTFLGSVQFDLLNTDNKDGRFEGTLMLAGYKGTMERAGSKITFGYDYTLEKDGFGPAAKKGDRNTQTGSLDLSKEHYVADDSSERAGRKIKRSYTEFKRLGDGSMICLAIFAHTINGKGDAETGSEAVYIHNGKDLFDFVTAKAAVGPEFQKVSFAEKGDLTKAQAVEAFKAAGFTIDQTGGVRDGKLFTDK
jgi:hypothetical protein